MNIFIFEDIVNFLKKHIFSILFMTFGIAFFILSFFRMPEEECPECICSLNETKEETQVKTIRVDVKGAVKNAKVYEMNEGDTVEDAIKKAGGIKSGATTNNINLSKKVYDEMVIYVFNKNEIEKKQTTNEIVYEVPECKCETIEVNDCVTNNSTIDNKISINNSSLEELLQLEGIGESKAKSIIEYREKNGPFKSIEEIKNVSGIGDKAFDAIKERIKL